MAKYEDIVKANATIKMTDVGRGKEYAEVPQRVKAFRMLYPNGSLTSEIISLENGVVIIKATACDENGNVLGTGHAYEKEGNGFINKTSYIENCVPITTQILTDGGWKYHFQIDPFVDKALSYNFNTGEMEYCKIERINLYESRPLVNLSTSRFNVTCTPEHKWLGRTQYRDLQKIATKDLTTSWKIVQAVRQDTAESILGRKLGWLMCDCDITDYNGLPSTAYISQSKYVDDVTELFGPGRKTKNYREGNWMDNYEWLVPASEVRNILGKFGMASYKDLPMAMVKAPIDHVAGCYRSMMLADGGSRGFSSTYIELVEAMQIMCARLGIATTFIKERMCQKSTRPIYELGIKKTDGAYFSEMVVKNVPPHDVWCPTTENGTWVMRQGTFVTLTSNCETSAWGRALAACGIIGGNENGPGSISSAEELLNAKKQQLEMEEEEKRAKVKKLLEETNSDVPKFLEWASEKCERPIKAVDEMRDKELDIMINQLEYTKKNGRKKKENK